MRDLAQVRERIMKEEPSPELRLRLGAAEDRVAKAAARLAQLRNPK